MFPSVPSKPRVGLKEIGPEGALTFVLSHIVLLASAGVLLCILFARVLRVARQATTSPPPAGTCLVFGMRLADEGRLPEDYRRRLERVLLLHRERPELELILLGGRTGVHDVSESGAGRDELLSRGVPAERIRIEDRSRHTLENISNVKAILEKQDGVIFVSNRYHLARCLHMARGFGFLAHPCAAEDAFEGTPRQWLLCLKEAYFLHWYVVGRAWACLSSNRNMLGRIGSCRPVP